MAVGKQLGSACPFNNLDDLAVCIQVLSDQYFEAPGDLEPPKWYLVPDPEKMWKGFIGWKAEEKSYNGYGKRKKSTSPDR